MSWSSFARHFKTQTGMTLLRWRMQTARGLLEESEQSIAVISEAVGYSSEVAFRKAFSAHVGVPPGQYRRDSRAEI